MTTRILQSHSTPGLKVTSLQSGRDFRHEEDLAQPAQSIEGDDQSY